MRLALLLGLSVALSGSVSAAEVSAAVAANFSTAAEELAAAFTAKTAHTVSLSFGATGALYTQISQGAPFEVFLSADAKRPALAVTEGLGVEGTVFTYAVGALALYGPGMNLTDARAVLAGGSYEHLAIADPATAPYGAAALATLNELGLTSAVEDRLVTGENITQALQFVESGNAELGFVALSQVIWLRRGQIYPEPPNYGKDIWEVPVNLYPPIRQDAVLLKAGADNPAAAAFLAFLRSDEAREIIMNHGYALDG